MGVIRYIREHSLHIARKGMLGIVTVLLSLGSGLIPIAQASVRADTPVCTVNAKLVNSCRPWFGGTAASYPQVASDKLSQMQYYETRTGRQMDVAHTYHGATDTALNATDLYFATRDNTYLFTNWNVANVWSDANGSNASVNARIDSMAASIKSLGSKKIFLTLVHEPEDNLTSDPNCPTTKFIGTSGTPADYKAMWANVESRFAADGVNNVVWAMDYMNYPGWNCVIQDVYPGDNLVDWIVFNAYQGSDNKVSFTNNVNNMYGILTANSTSDHNYLSKPWGIVEWGIHNSSQASAYQYYAQAQAAVDNNTFPNLKMYMAFDETSPQTGDGSFRVAYDKSGNYDAAEQSAYNAFANDPNLTGGSTYIGGDSTAPVVSLTNPADGDTVNGSVAISGTSNDETLLSRTDLLVDGQAVASTAGSGTVSFNWDSTGVADGPHSLQLQATDAAGNTSLSNAITVNVRNIVPDTTPPTAPANLTATAGSGLSNQLSWTAASDDRAVTGYQIYRNGSLITSVDGATTTYLDNSSLSDNTAYSYYVTASDAAGNVSAPSNSAAVTTPDLTPPAQVTGLMATATSGHTASLSWNASTDNAAVAGYYVYRNGALIATVAPANTTFSDGNLTDATAYQYSIVAFDAAGNQSTPSNLQSITTPDVTAPAAPTNLTATAGNNQVTLNWTAATDNVSVTGYRVYRGATLLATTTGTTYVDSGLSDLTTYAYTVSAYDAAGNISSVASASAKTPDATAPTAPTKLTATLSGTSVSLSWTKSTDTGGVKSYTIYRGTTAIATVTGTTYTDTAAPQGKSASYTVKATDTSGNSSTASNTVSVSVPDKTAPAAPTNLTVTAGTKKVTLSWKAATDNVAVTGYYLYRGSTKIATLSASATSYTDSGLTTNTTYTYKLIAFDAAGNQSSSVSTSAKAK